jgi:hypothetical protein
MGCRSPVAASTVPWCSSRQVAAHGGAGQSAIAGRLTAASSLNGEMVSSATLTGPFIVLFEQNCANEAYNGVLIG